MSSVEEVQRFLVDFKLKLSVFDILFRDDRGKNTQTLIDLELRPNDRVEMLKNLAPDDYSEGPIPELLYGGSDMWIFGKSIGENEVYIKISLGYPGASVICISFHVAEYKMNFPFRD